MLSSMKLPEEAAPAPSRQVAAAYSTFLIVAGTVYFGIAQRSFASIQTLAGMSQCFGMVLLTMQVLGDHSMEGISLESLALSCAAFACRLSSTLFFDGYLPVDASGDGTYQAFDVLGLLLAAYITVRNIRNDALRPSVTFVLSVSLSALSLAALLHGNMDKRPFFDTLWMAGVFLASAAIVPQLMALRRLSAKASPLPGHALSATAMSQVLSFIYIWHARNDMTCDAWVEGFNHAVWAVLIAHVVPILLTCEFWEDWFVFV